MRRTILALLAIMITSIIFYALSFQKESFEEKRIRILNELSVSIEEAISQGKYECCIDPPCTMCYLGNWLWEDGICRCDEMITKDEFDKVCPQCVEGIREGICKSGTRCEI